MGRGVLSYIIFFLLGTICGNLINLPNFVFLLTLSIAAFSISLCIFCYKKIIKSFITQKQHSLAFIYLSHLSIFCLGICNYHLHYLLPPLEIINKIEVFALEKRDTIIPYLSKYIKNEDLKIIKALVLGNRSEISKELIEAYKLSGTLHLLALSGLHVSILYSALNITLYFLNFSYKTKYIQVIISTIVICCYALISGMSASVIRAVIMIIVYRICSLTDKNSNKINTLAISAFIIVVFSPKQLFAIGFQLSFSAMLGISYILPELSDVIVYFKDSILNDIKKKFKSPQKIIYICIVELINLILSTISISLACQIATFPISFYYFSYSAPHFLLSNIIAIPLVTLILYLFCLSILFYPIPCIANLIGIVLEHCINILNFSINFIAF